MGPGMDPDLAGGGRNRRIPGIAAITPAPDNGGVRRITLVAYPGVQTLDVTGPYEVFAMANRFTGESGPASYDLEIVAQRAGAPELTVESSSGLRLGLHRAI